MSIHFNGSGNFSARASFSGLTDWPISMAFWFNVEDVTNDHIGVSVGYDDGVNYYRSELLAAGTRGGDPVRIAQKGETAFRAANSSTGFSANTWHHAMGVITSSTLREAWIDGGSGGSSTPNAGILGTAYDTVNVGRNINAGDNCIGKIAEIGVWNAALTASEIASLAAGYSPQFVRPDSLIFYMPGVGGNAIVDRVGAPLTVTGTATSDVHPPVFYPKAQILQFPPAAAVGGTTPHSPFGLPLHGPFGGPI